MPQTDCPGCDAIIRVDKPRMGATTRCHQCGAELEIVSTSPLEVYFAFEQDWYDEWEDQYEEQYATERMIKRRYREARRSAA